MADIVIAAALVVGDDGDTLLVRKRGTTAFLQPGGKIEPSETAEQALIREMREELGLTVDIARLGALGRFEAEAANEAGHRVVAHLFRLDIDKNEKVEAAAEIDEIAWISVSDPPHIPMAALTEFLILPFYRQIVSAGKT
jgi:8-oxo-dGTP pyrophosphatase MutT (NUDIX family)